MATHYVDKPEIKTADALHKTLRERRDSGIGKHDDIRLHRAISWLTAAERYKDDTDVAFMCFWNCYEATYQIEDPQRFNRNYEAMERERLTKVVKIDKSNELLIIMLQGYKEYLYEIFANKYLSKRYYEWKLGYVKDWERQFTQDLKEARAALTRNDTAKLLDFSLFRLGTLRNQMLHGSATYQGSINRETLDKANSFMSEIMPKMVEIMLTGNGWGEIQYDILDQPTDGKD